MQGALRRCAIKIENLYLYSNEQAISNYFLFISCVRQPFNNFFVSQRRQDAKKSCFYGFNRKVDQFYQTLCVLCVFARITLYLPQADKSPFIPLSRGSYTSAPITIASIRITVWVKNLKYLFSKQKANLKDSPFSKGARGISPTNPSQSNKQVSRQRFRFSTE